MAVAQPGSTDSDFSDDDQSPLDTIFNKAAEHLRKITNKITNDQLLELYGLFKQGSEGKCNIARPGFFDARGRKKWDAWNVLGEMSQELAKQRYVELMKKFDPEFEGNENKTGTKETWVTVSSLRRSSSPELDVNSMTLLEAAKEDCGERVAELLKKNSKLIDHKDEDGLTALHWAADRNSTSALTAVIEAGCNINAVDDSGQTALHYAASCGHVKATKILVDAGASLVMDEDNCTPLDLAADEEVKKVLEGATK